MYAAFAAGDEGAQRSVRDVAEALGRAMATLVNALNPERILLGGSLSLLLDAARPEIENSLERFALEAQGRTVQVLQPSLGADSALVGAAEIAFTPLLNDPLLAGTQLAG